MSVNTVQVRELKPKRAITKSEGGKKKKSKTPSNLYYMKHVISQPDPAEEGKRITATVVCSYPSKEVYEEVFCEDLSGWEDMAIAANRLAGLDDEHGDDDDDHETYPSHCLESSEELPAEPKPIVHLHLYFDKRFGYPLAKIFC